MSPLRLLNAWIDHQRLAERRRQVEWQLGVVFTGEFVKQTVAVAEITSRPPCGNLLREPPTPPA